jgi:hypothetical protein
MNKELNSLVSYLKKTNNPAHSKIFKLAKDYTQTAKDKEMDPTLDIQSIGVNIDDLKSLVDSNMKFETEKIGLVAIEK